MFNKTTNQPHSYGIEPGNSKCILAVTLSFKSSLIAIMTEPRPRMMRATSPGRTAMKSAPNCNKITFKLNSRFSNQRNSSGIRSGYLQCLLAVSLVPVEFADNYHDKFSPTNQVTSPFRRNSNEMFLKLQENCAWN